MTNEEILIALVIVLQADDRRDEIRKVLGLPVPDNSDLIRKLTDRLLAASTTSDCLNILRDVPDKSDIEKEILHKAGDLADTIDACLSVGLNTPSEITALEKKMQKKAVGYVRNFEDLFEVFVETAKGSEEAELCIKKGLELIEKQSRVSI